jgi:oligosaccharide repeat unit polymerase
MLFKVVFLQITIYLFIAPLARILLGKEIKEYHFGIALIFVFFFLISGLIFRGKRPKYLHRIDVLKLDTEKNYKWLIIIAWIAVCTLMSFTYGLSDRRIGTEVVAELFASIPPFELMIFRVLEIALPFLMSCVLLNFFDNKNSVTKNSGLVLAIVFAFFILGAGSSRSATGLFMLSILLMIQNKFEPKTLLRLLYKAGIFAGVIFFAVTASRMSANDDVSVNEYFSSEVLQRVDGLEVVSQIIDKYGYQMTGINTSAALNPITSLVPFLDRAKELKADALTTVKAVILEQELDSKSRDVNSFIILDTYYCGGILGVTLVAILIAYFSRLADKKIGITSNWIFQIFLIAIIINFVVMEREAVGMVISIVRDWLILCIVALVLLSRTATVHRRIK